MKYQCLGDGDNRPAEELPPGGIDFKITHIVTTPNGTELKYTRHICLTADNDVLQVQFIPPGKNAHDITGGRAFDWPHEPARKSSLVKSSEVKVAR